MNLYNFWFETRRCIGKIIADFIWHMEDVLDPYEPSYDPKHPVICFDERPCQLIDDSIIPSPIKSGRPKKNIMEDYDQRRILRPT